MKQTAVFNAVNGRRISVNIRPEAKIESMPADWQAVERCGFTNRHIETDHQGCSGLVGRSSATWRR